MCQAGAGGAGTGGARRLCRRSGRFVPARNPRSSGRAQGRVGASALLEGRRAEPRGAGEQPRLRRCFSRHSKREAPLPGRCWAQPAEAQESSRGLRTALTGHKRVDFGHRHLPSQLQLGSGTFFESSIAKMFHLGCSPGKKNELPRLFVKAGGARYPAGIPGSRPCS